MERGHKLGERGNLSLEPHSTQSGHHSVGFPCPQGFDDIINKGGIGPLTGELHPPVTHSFLPANPTDEVATATTPID